MQELPPTLPEKCEVLVIGAGPAGSACALRLAAAGRDVVLVDQHVFPRDKICGDGLIPDSHAALRRLGLYDEVAAQAEPVHHVRCVGTRGHHVDVPGTLSVLPRKALDDILVRGAQRAGARLLAPWRFEAPLLDGERVVGARLRPHGSADAVGREIAARWVVIATGAVPQGITAAGLCRRHTPTGIALRGYVHNDAMRDRIRQLQLVWHPRLRGGYGWIFPAPGGVFNIGFGLIGSHLPSPGRADKGRMQDVNLRRLFEDFCALYAPAAELMAGGRLVGDIKGAPLRCSLQGARWSRPGMIGVGEAIGSTYSFSGEGIGKAMETGLLAADAIATSTATSDEAPVRRQYEQALLALKPKFDLYRRAEQVNAYPWLIDLVIWRANRSARLLQRMSGVLNETSNPGHLLSLRGFRRLFLE